MKVTTKPAPARDCLNCQGAGQRSWPQSRRNPRNPLEVIERLAPQITKCGACNGSGVIRLDRADDQIA